MIYKIPIIMAVPEAEAYLFPKTEGHWVAAFLDVWFVVGGIKIAIMMEWHKKEPLGSLTETHKAMLLTPIVAFMSFNKEWYRLPPISKD